MKKLSEYEIQDIKDLFSELLKKISSKIILLEIGNDFLNIGLAKSQNNKLYIKKIISHKLPEEALDKSIPTDPNSLGIFLKQIMNEQKFYTNRVAISLPSDTCYTRLIDIPEEIKEDEAIGFIENVNSGIQIPISLKNSDFDISLTDLPKKEYKNKSFNTYFLTSLPKKNVDIVLDSIKNANLDICSLQISHMCIAKLLKTEIDKLNNNELIISIELLDQFTQFVIFDSSGPLVIKRLASIRNYPSIEEMKKMQNINAENSNDSKVKSKTDSYHSLSKLDLKVLLREINESFNEFLNKNNLNKKGKIFLSGRNSQHKNLVEILGKNLKMDVALISPINNFCLKEFSYNPDEINQFSMSRLIGLGLTLIKDFKLEDESLNRQFIVKSFSNNNNLDMNLNNIDLSHDFKKENKKELAPLPNIKNKSQENRKENKKELAPLPNIKNKSQENKKLNVKSEIKNNELGDKQNKDNEKNKKIDSKNKSFKIDPTFLKND